MDRFIFEYRNDSIKYKKVIKFKIIKVYIDWDRKKMENMNVMVNFYCFFLIFLYYNKIYDLIVCNSFVNIFKFYFFLYILLDCLRVGLFLKL